MFWSKVWAAFEVPLIPLIDQENSGVKFILTMLLATFEPLQIKVAHTVRELQAYQEKRSTQYTSSGNLRAFSASPSIFVLQLNCFHPTDFLP
jgi:hypothetical protein